MNLKHHRFETKTIFCGVLFAFLSLVGASFADEGTRVTPHNIILFIGDGMGQEQIRASRLVRGSAHTFENLPYQGYVTTYSANDVVTDSAAAATAIATGIKVNNGVVSLKTPGDGSELKTLLEYFKDRGKAVGLVTTTNITAATPAAFGSHEASRNSYAAIAADYFQQTKPNVLMGGGHSSYGITAAAAQDAGYTVVTNATALQDINTETTDMISGQFGDGNMPYEYDGLGTLPHLSDMVHAALRVLDNDPDGFFLMVEGGLIDYAGHANDLPRNVAEVAEFSEAVAEALSWLPTDSETLIIVTSDHETGGLSVTSETLTGGYPSVSWSTGSHTATNVKVFASGYGAEDFTGTIDNTDFFAKIITAGERYNTAPTVNAGDDIKLHTPITGSPTCQFDATVTDDDIYTSAGVSHTWTQTSGSTALISSTTSLNPTITPSTPGTYIFQLTASDGYAQASDTIAVNVIDPPAVRLSRKISNTQRRRQAYITLSKANASQPLFDTAGCEINFYILNNQYSVPKAASKLFTLAAPKSRLVINLPFVPDNLTDPTAENKSLYMQAHLVCNDGIKVRSEKTKLALVSKGTESAVRNYWRTNYTISSSN